MRRYQRYLLVMTGAVLFACSGTAGTTACARMNEDPVVRPQERTTGPEEKGPGIGLKDKNTEKAEAEAKQENAGEQKNAGEQELMGNIAAASETDSLILVVGQGGADISLSYHTKNEEGIWTEEFETMGRYGKNGATDDKKEGDKKTPLGTYRFTMAFGVKENPGSILPYHRLTDTDYWVDDPESSHYNRLVDSRSTKKDWKSAEHMAAMVPFYHYGLALDYNSDCVPGNGSAIFLHCMNGTADTGTSGCVKVPEEYMKKLVTSVDEDTRIVIVSDISRLEQENGR